MFANLSTGCSPCPEGFACLQGARYHTSFEKVLQQILLVFNVLPEVRHLEVGRPRNVNLVCREPTIPLRGIHFSLSFNNIVLAHPLVSLVMVAHHRATIETIVLPANLANFRLQ